MKKKNTPSVSNAADDRRNAGPTCYFVSRHEGAVEWAKRHHWGQRAKYVSHLDPSIVQAGDTVIGTLPIHLAAAVCARGACYLHLALDLVAGQRGCELRPDELDAANARLIHYSIREAPWSPRKNAE